MSILFKLNEMLIYAREDFFKAFFYEINFGLRDTVGIFIFFLRMPISFFKLEWTANTTLVHDITWLVFWKLSTSKDNGFFMHAIVYLSTYEIETDTDICICGKIRDVVSSHPSLPCLCSPPPPPSSSFLFKSLLRPWRETNCTNVAYFEGWRLLSSKLLGVDISSGW